MNYILHRGKLTSKIHKEKNPTAHTIKSMKGSWGDGQKYSQWGKPHFPSPPVHTESES